MLRLDAQEVGWYGWETLQLSGFIYKLIQVVSVGLTEKTTRKAMHII